MGNGKDSSTHFEVTRELRYDERPEQLLATTAQRHVFQVFPYYHVSVRLVDDDHEPLPSQGAALTLPDGAERQLQIGGDGILKYHPAPKGVCSLTVADPGRVVVRFPTVPDDELVIVVRVPPKPLFAGKATLPAPPPHAPVRIAERDSSFLSFAVQPLALDSDLARSGERS